MTANRSHCAPVIPAGARKGIRLGFYKPSPRRLLRAGVKMSCGTVASPQLSKDVKKTNVCLSAVENLFDFTDLLLDATVEFVRTTGGLQPFVAD